jgi:hypothetical protein
MNQKSKNLIFATIIFAITLGACSRSNEETLKAKKINDSIAKAEAEATEQEAIVAERMIDSANAVLNDTIKK